MSDSALDERAKNYQAKVGDKYVFVADMTREQLQQVLCDAFDFIEEVRDLAAPISARIDKWLYE